MLKTVMDFARYSVLLNIYKYIYIYIYIYIYTNIFEVSAYDSTAITLKMSLSIVFWIAFFHILFILYFNLFNVMAFSSYSSIIQ